MRHAQLVERGDEGAFDSTSSLGAGLAEGFPEAENLGFALLEGFGEGGEVLIRGVDLLKTAGEVTPEGDEFVAAREAVLVQEPTDEVQACLDLRQTLRAEGHFLCLVAHRVCQVLELDTYALQTLAPLSGRCMVATNALDGAQGMVEGG